MLVQVTATVGGLEYPINPGDIISGMELAPATIANAAGVSITAAQLAAGDIFRSGAAAVSDTLDTADNICKALFGSINKVSPPDNALYGTLPNQGVQLAWPANLQPFTPGMSFRRTIMSSNSGLLTIAVVANAGVSLVGTTTIAATSWREYLIRIVNSSPTVTLSCTTTNANAVLTAVDLVGINNITAGMSVSGTNIPASTTVVAVNRDLGTITLSQNATGTGTFLGITFTPTVTVTGLRGGTL